MVVMRPKQPEARIDHSQRLKTLGNDWPTPQTERICVSVCVCATAIFPTFSCLLVCRAHDSMLQNPLAFADCRRSHTYSAACCFGMFKWRFY